MRLTLKSLITLCLLSSSSVYAVKVNMAPKETAIEDEFIVTFKPAKEGLTTNAKGQSVLSKDQMASIAKDYGAQVTHNWTTITSGITIKTTQAIAEKIANLPNVKFVDQNAIVTKDQSVTWGLDRVDQRDLPLDNSYNPRNNGSGVRAYILDTGVRISHNEFQGRAEWGENFVGDGIDDDCDGHGTHVAGTVAGATYGVGKAVDIVAVKVLGCNGSGTWAGIIDGCEWVANDAAAHPESKATANLSIGGGVNQGVNDAVGNLHDSGVVTVVSAGNSNTNACNQSPASEPRVITVGSTEIDDDRSSFSNYGSCVDIFAPGTSITSAWYTSDTATNTISGTSMASPHVCGAAALTLKANVAPEDVTDYLIDIATPDVVDNPGPNSPNLLLFAGNVMPTISPAPTIHFPSAEPSNSPAPTPSCGDEIVVSILTDNFPSETSYEIKNTCNDELVFERSSFPSSNTLYEDEICTRFTGGKYDFTIFDSFGDGICCGYGNGSYEVTLNGDVVASGGDFDDSETTTFGTCDTAAPVAAPTAAPTATPTAAPTLSPDTCVDADLLVPYQGNLLSCDTIVNAGGCSNALAPTHCPKGCDKCEAYACEDSEAPWTVLGQVFNCGQLASQDPGMIPLYCDTFDLTTTCRSTCGFC